MTRITPMGEDVTAVRPPGYLFGAFRCPPRNTAGLVSGAARRTCRRGAAPARPRMSGIGWPLRRLWVTGAMAGSGSRSRAPARLA